MSAMAPQAPRSEVSAEPRPTLQKILLSCGIGYGVTYVVASDLIAAAMFNGYSRLDQAISELSGTEAPSRGFLTAMMPAFILLVLGFGIGVWRAAGPAGRCVRPAPS